MITLNTLRTFQRIRFVSSSLPRPCARTFTSIPSSAISHNNHASSLHSSGPNSAPFSSKESESHKRKFPKHRMPPLPPGGSATLPTVDASPILAPSVYIKRTSTAAHSIAGPDATKRLLIAQHKICTWIWNQIGLPGDDNGGLHGEESQFRNQDEEAAHSCDDGSSLEQEYNHLGFMLVGHGVPYLLFQDHVDCAWDMLNNDSGAVDDGEVVECSFSSDSGKLHFDWIKLRKRDNTVAKHPLPSMSEKQSEQLYLAVMNRISTTLGTILLTQPPPNSPTINTDKYWKKDISSPISYWRATFKRGFVYPPSVTSTYSFDSYDQRGGGKESGEYWTGPPIVELISSNGHVIEKNDNPSFVRVTLQGIPSVFWKEEDCDADVRKDDMVPVSLVFEACFEQGKSD